MDLFGNGVIGGPIRLLERTVKSREVLRFGRSLAYVQDVRLSQPQK